MARRKNKNNKTNKQSNNNKQPKVIVKTVTVPQPMSIGAQIGDRLQKFGETMFTRLLGKGDYSIQDNVSDIKKNTLFTDTPKKPLRFGSNSTMVSIEHSEYVGPIISSATPNQFNLVSYPCDPSNPVSFPWLSQIALNFEQFEVEGLIYRIETTSGTAISGTDSGLGSMMTAFIYDPTTEMPVNKQTLLQIYGSCSSVISKSQLVGVECAKDSQAMDKLYVREADSSEQTRFNTKGNFVVATQGVKGASQYIGDLYVHYKIKLLFPRENTVNVEDADIMFIASNTASTSINTVIDFTPGVMSFYSASLSIGPLGAANRPWINGLSKDQYYLVFGLYGYASTSPGTFVPPTLAGAVTTVYSGGGTATAPSPSTDYYGYSICKVNGTDLNSVYLNTAVFSGGGTVTIKSYIRIQPLVNFQQADWTLAEQVTPRLT